MGAPSFDAAPPSKAGGWWDLIERDQLTRHWLIQKWHRLQGLTMPAPAIGWSEQESAAAMVLVPFSTFAALHQVSPDPDPAVLEQLRGTVADHDAVTRIAVWRDGEWFATAASRTALPVVRLEPEPGTALHGVWVSAEPCDRIEDELWAAARQHPDRAIAWTEDGGTAAVIWIDPSPLP